MALVPVGLGVNQDRNTLLPREFCRLPLMAYWLLGAIVIPLVWWQGGQAWMGLLSALLGLVGGGALVWAVRIIGSAAMGREAMGFGDVTLMMMMGAFVGWQACLIIFLLAPFAGLAIGLLQLVLHRDDVIPFGPFLCLAALAVIIAWGPIWDRAQVAFGAGSLVPAVIVICLFLLAALLALLQVIKKLFLGGGNPSPGGDDSL